VTTGIVLPSKVVSLVIRRPPHFAFKPGDYIFVNIPAIATFEWHPFTISSAPEQVRRFQILIIIFLPVLTFYTLGYFFVTMLTSICKINHFDWFLPDLIFDFGILVLENYCYCASFIKIKWLSQLRNLQFEAWYYFTRTVNV
jgi:hypothetical protein